jgi:hypothetical protein
LRRTYQKATLDTCWDHPTEIKRIEMRGSLSFLSWKLGAISGWASHESQDPAFLKTFTHYLNQLLGIVRKDADGATRRKDWALHSSAWWRGGDAINLATFSDTLPTVNSFFNQTCLFPFTFILPTVVVKILAILKICYLVKHP